MAKAGIGGLNAEAALLRHAQLLEEPGAVVHEKHGPKPAQFSVDDRVVFQNKYVTRKTITQLAGPKNDVGHEELMKLLNKITTDYDTVLGSQGCSLSDMCRVLAMS